MQSGHRAGPDQIEPNSDADTKAMHTQHYMKGGRRVHGRGGQGVVSFMGINMDANNHLGQPM